jgi:hypothetical protein
MPDALPSPGQFDLELIPVFSDFDFYLEVDLIGHLHGETEALALEFRGVVTFKGVCEGVEPSGRLLATDVLGYG